MTIAEVVGAMFGLYAVGFSFGVIWAMVFNFFENFSR